MRVGIYGRVSTSDKGQDVQMQMHELRQYANNRKWEVIGEYVDQGHSGAKESRPALNRLMADAKQRKFEAIVVWKLDRFGRSLKHLVTALAELDAVGVVFVSLKDGFDLTTPGGRAMFGMCAVMAEFERALICERVRSGMENARRKGRRLGRSAVYVDMGVVAARRASGESLRAIARDLRVSPALLVKRAKAGVL
jgi:DNA invertase Pin-like site-specific DNA recombinase